MSKISLIRNVGILLVSAACFAACTPEEYAPCSIPNTTSHKAACAPMGDSRTATCTADYVFDCDSLICGIYNSSAPFCTKRCIPTVDECKKSVTDIAKCTTEGDSKGVSYMKCPGDYDCVTQCPEGAACVEWTPGTGGFFCLPADKKGLATSGSNSSNNNNNNADNDNSDNNASNDNNGNDGNDNTGNDNTGDTPTEEQPSGDDNTGDNPADDAGDETPAE